jgi:hypothetical protein
MLLHGCLVACTATLYTSGIKTLAMTLSCCATCCPCLHLLLLLLLLLLSVAREGDCM